jgi:PKD repeat protein
MAVDVDAHRGGKGAPQPLEYSFDFGDDAKPAAPGATPTAHHTYARPGEYTIRVNVKDPRWGTSASVKQKVEVR